MGFMNKDKIGSDIYRLFQFLMKGNCDIIAWIYQGITETAKKRIDGQFRLREDIIFENNNPNHQIAFCILKYGR